ncbi:6-phosphogluconolactonase [Coccinella septempunctata]|uniref:6-phosphogluconolactonase n=1 Tax=Coccinella septempunctata TaxID=41139 RepID=UPI001D0782F8|nr:6-phosphogluconolactonase [Coccinella septempunctata]
MQIIVVKNRDEVISKLMDLVQNIAEESISKNGVFTIGLSGGSLGSFLATGLPKLQADLTKWKLFFCDERVVPEDSNDSTYGFYKTTLIGSTKLKEEQFIKIKQGVSAKEAAEDYVKQMKEHFPEGKLPRFDLLLLGMGPDGHTCSLFPSHPLLKENEKWIAAITDSPKPPPERITMTFKVINNARNCIFAMCGKEKAPMVKRILKDKENLPAGQVIPTNGEVYWVLDEGAAKETK